MTKNGPDLDRLRERVRATAKQNQVSKPVRMLRTTRVKPAILLLAIVLGGVAWIATRGDSSEVPSGSVNTTSVAPTPSSSTATVTSAAAASTPAPTIGSPVPAPASAQDTVPAPTSPPAAPVAQAPTPPTTTPPAPAPTDSRHQSPCWKYDADLYAGTEESGAFVAPVGTPHTVSFYHLDWYTTTVRVVKVDTSCNDVDVFVSRPGDAPAFTSFIGQQWVVFAAEDYYVDGQLASRAGDMLWNDLAGRQDGSWDDQNPDGYDAWPIPPCC